MRERLTDWPYSSGQSLFIISLVLYLLTRLIGLADYPIYFFTDEAIQTNLAADFIRDGLRNHDKEFLPTFFRNVDRFNLSISVYAQVIPYLFFGKSVFVTRAVSALFSLLGAYWIGLTLRDIFKSKLWWSGVLLLSIAPAWFLHSRTAFETVMMASFYAGFLYYYLSYRYLDPKKLYWALSLGALAFYTYSPGRVVVVLTGLLFLLSDFRYHLKNKAVALRGLGVLGLLMLPFLRFQIAHPTANIDQLRLMGSYLLQSIPTSEKLSNFWTEYLFGLNPGYWFFDTTRDFSRHLMGDLGHLLPITIPLGIVGFLVTLKSFRSSSAHRAVLIALFVAPVGAALVLVGITRVLVYVIPAILLFSLGLEAVVNWLRGRGLNANALSYSTFILLAAATIGFARNALVNGPLWSSDYGMGGMQYGATQLYGAVEEYIDENPATEFIITPNWANGAGILADFFFPKGRPFTIGSIHGHIDWQNLITDNTMFVTIPSERDLIVESGKFKDIIIQKTINYPDGNPGFYFITLSYVDDIEAIFAAEIEERSKPIEVRQELVSGKSHSHSMDAQQGPPFSFFDLSDFQSLDLYELIGNVCP
ncbi:MAG: glycosyltransferase family 39 protein, partial [Chloroflexi bacterium]|nr:glycosyltransferase family 39 protein [Chloroflexota bacterium]